MSPADTRVPRRLLGTRVQRVLYDIYAAPCRSSRSDCPGWRPRCARKWLSILSATMALLLALVCGPLSGANKPPQGGQFQLESGAFQAGGFIPRKYTCSGDNVSPALTWRDAPGGTKSLVLIVADPDAPGGTWIHWVIFNLPPDAHRLPEGVPKAGEVAGGARQGTTSFQEVGYGGPCPPPGNAHHYHFKLYALNVQLSLRAGADSDDVDRAMKGHILAETELVGLYKR